MNKLVRYWQTARKSREEIKKAGEKEKWFWAFILARRATSARLNAGKGASRSHRRRDLTTKGAEAVFVPIEDF